MRMNKVQPKSKRTPKELHRAAMAECDLADPAGRRGDAVKQRIYLENALRLETLAAEGARGAEPSKSILFHSATEIALELQEFNEAKRLALCGLSGDPPKDVAKALRQQLETPNVAHSATKLDITARKTRSAS